MDFYHTSVLLQEAVEALNICPDGCYIDATLGGGGHSAEICRKLIGENGRLIGIDQDERALVHAVSVLSKYSDKVTFVHSNFSDIKYIKSAASVDLIDGVVMDLGVSSHQFDTPERGFSYNYDAPLDMRMDLSGGLSAYDVINDYSEADLTRVLWEYGQEKWSKRIAQFICQRRASKPIQTTFELVSVIKAAVPKKARQDGKHPAKRTFMAIRIEVNQELEILERSIRNFVGILRPGGRICVITFHSLEDRIVKQMFRKLESPCICPRELYKCACGKTSELRVITKKPIIASKEELEINNRAHSAKLRVAEKL